MYPFFKNFATIYYPIFIKFDPCFRIFRKGSNWDTCLQNFFSYFLNPPIWVAYPCVSYIYVKVPPPAPPPSPTCRAPKLFWFHQFMECIVMRILQPNYEKSVGKGHLFENVILAGTLEWREHQSEGGPCGCLLSPGARGFAHPEPIGVTPLL